MSRHRQKYGPEVFEILCDAQKFPNFPQVGAIRPRFLHKPIKARPGDRCGLLISGKGSANNSHEDLHSPILEIGYWPNPDQTNHFIGT